MPKPQVDQDALKESIRIDFESRAKEMCDNFAKDLLERMLKAYDALTPDEVEKLRDPVLPQILVRAMAMAKLVGPYALSQRFEVASSVPLTRRLNRILNKRYW